MAIDSRLALAALPSQNTFQAFTGGQQAAHQNALYQQTVQSNQNALGQQTAQSIARGVLDAPDPAAAYPQARATAAAMGMDVSAFPEQWNEQADMMVRMAAMPEDELTEFERMIQHLPPEEQMRARRVKLNLEPAAAQAGDGAKVGAQEILPSGVIIQSTPQGPVVWAPTGERLEGPEAAAAIREAEAYGVENERNKYGARREGTLGADIDMGGEAAGAKKGGEIAAELGKEAYTGAQQLATNISTIDEAIAALDAGAKAGAVDKWFPDISLASASLANALDRMGLDVISATTFGALSEGELRLAMETAAPRNLNERELKQWLQKKREAQVKARDMLTDASQFLSTPGNTLADWIAKNRGGGGAGGLADVNVEELSDEEILQMLEAQ